MKTTADIGTLGLVGNSPAFLGVLRQVATLARVDAPVLIEGETGTGKEAVARAIHYLGARHEKAFVPINCGAIPDSLIESELFGHDRGAFTDAKEARAGMIAQAHDGTLFLDEIESFSPKAQVTLLRFLQDQRYRPLGHGVELRGNVRVIAASNRALSKLVAENQFRSDLFYRLNVFYLPIPPLRHRAGDVELLAQYFMTAFSTKYGLPPKRLHPDTLAWIRNHHWPGNIRELENLIHRELLQAGGDEIIFRGDAPRWGAGLGEDGEREACPDFHTAKACAIAAFERAYLTRMLTEAHGNVTLAARNACQERRAFGRLLKKHRIDPNQFRT